MCEQGKRQNNGEVRFFPQDLFHPHLQIWSVDDSLSEFLFVTYSIVKQPRVFDPHPHPYPVHTLPACTPYEFACNVYSLL